MGSAERCVVVLWLIDAARAGFREFLTPHNNVVLLLP
jgi:hypothetical protein